MPRNPICWVKSPKCPCCGENSLVLIERSHQQFSIAKISEDGDIKSYSPGPVEIEETEVFCTNCEDYWPDRSFISLYQEIKEQEERL